MGKKPRSHVKKIVFIVIFSIVMLELTLFLSGRYLLWQRRVKRNRVEAVRIVCVGDSHTFGVGTSMQYSYPAQLERLLTLNNYNQRFSVINLGIPGASTKRQIQELTLFFDNNDAKIVILITGRNNHFEIEERQNPVLYNNIARHIGNLRSFKFLKAIFERILKKHNQQDSNVMLVHKKKYADYLDFYLEQIRRLCSNKGAKLMLLSYYNSTDDVVKDFANKHNIPYFDFTSDFDSLFTVEEKSRYISPDMSHMNHLGYKFFAEQLYGYLFLKQAYLGFKINPLLQRLEASEFYSDDKEIERMVKAQEERIEQSKNSGEYPFELIHLGHIYIEIGDEESAKKCYIDGLVASNYTDNNTIVSPILNWYLRKGRKEDALKICEEIMLHNPANSIARSYRDWLLTKPEHLEGG